MLSPASVPARRPDVAEAALDGSAVLYDPVAERTHVLNPSAAAVWASVDGVRSATAIAGGLEAELGAHRGEVMQAIEAFAAAGLLDDGRAERSPGQPVAPVSHATAGEDQAEGLRVLGPYEGLGVAFAVAVPEELAPTLERSLRCLAPRNGASPAPHRFAVRRRPSGGYALWLDGHLVLEADDGPSVLSHLLIRANGTVVHGAGGGLCLHAGGVVVDGQAVVVVGGKDAGKSTLVTALVREGFPYLSDEAVVVGADGRVRSYPKPLGLDRGAWPLFPELEACAAPAARRWWVNPLDVGAGAAVVPNGSSVPLGLVLFVTFEDRAELTVDPLDPLDAARALAEGQFNLRGDPHRRLPILASIAGTTPCSRMVRRDLDGAVAWIRATAGGAGPG